MEFRKVLTTSGLLYLSWSFNPLFAQTPPPKVPPGILQPPRPSPFPLPLETPPPVPQLTPPPAPPLTPTPDSRSAIKVKRVVVLGSTVFSPAELEAVTAPFIGKEATFEDLLAIRSAITQLYIDKGYTTSGAFLPPQEIAEGTVIIQVVEGAIERIDIEGLEHLREAYVRDRIGLAAVPPINLRRLEEALQLLQLNPLFQSVQAQLSAGTAPGLTVLTLKLKEASPFSASLEVGTLEPPSVGGILSTVAVADDNLLGFGDSLSVSYGISEGINQYNFNYAIPLNPHEGTLSLRYQKYDSQVVQEPFSQFGITGNNYTLSLGFRQPIIRTPSTEFALALSLGVEQSQTYLFNNIPFSFSLGPEQGKSRITPLRFSQEWVNRSTDQVLALRSQFNFGLPIFGATDNDTGVDGQFTSWQGQFQWVRGLGPDTLLLARLDTQLSFNPLLPLEQFTIGGINTVRGYPTNSRIGDNGVVGSVEVRLPIVRDPEGIGLIQLVPFFDIGTVWNNDSEFRPLFAPSTLASLGLELRWQLASYWSARLNWGIQLNPLQDQGNSLQDNGIQFEVRYQPF